ncbi:hypothetical protein LP420_05230 [Massilia sp. B-10]|nr:hypothetical protein LP420_05230 [Massilia sp. B-10]
MFTVTSADGTASTVTVRIIKHQRRGSPEQRDGAADGNQQRSDRPSAP